MTENTGNSSLIVTSLRLPFVTYQKENDGTVGRMESKDEWARSLAHIVSDSGGHWVGWAGPGLAVGDSVPLGDDESCAGARLGGDQVYPVHLDQETMSQMYKHCRQGLWPLFHSMADRAVFDEEHWAIYKKVNQIVAESTLKALKSAIEKKPGNVPVIWIHGYHLMEVANIIRKVTQQDNISCKIGYFMHIPFPPWDMIRIHPWKDIFLQGMLGSDLIGFQCTDFALNFVDCCERGLGTRVDRKLMMVEHGAGGRRVKVTSLPLGVPFERFGILAETAPPIKFNDVHIPKDSQMILSVDTLDYTKGLLQRITAFEKLLEKYHIHREKVVLVQVCVQSRHEDGETLLQQLQARVETLNRQHGNETWTPVILIKRALEEEELAALYRDSNVAMVLPLRDGMNLTGKEFVSCRIYRGKPGVLLLSPFIGAAEIMQEALIVNPYEVSKVADYLHSALTMSVAEAEVRMTALRAREKVYDLKHWMDSFFSQLLNSPIVDSEEIGVKHNMSKLTMDDFGEILGSYMAEPGWSKLCLLLDYDGTLAPHGSHPDLTVLPDKTRDVLQRLADMPELFIAVITGRCIPDIKNKVNIKNITYAGNHGIDIRHPDGTRFVPPMPEEVEERACWLLKMLQAECCENGAWVENKGIVLALHHEAWKEKNSIDPDKKERLLSRARELMTEAGFKIGMSDGGLVTEAKPGIKWDKGDAAIYILRSAFGVNWRQNIRVIFAGDDLTDEDAMKALKGLAYNFRVINSELVQTMADHRLPDTAGVQTMLHWLENFMLCRRNNNFQKV